jgi:hypothetical protein
MATRGEFAKALLPAIGAPVTKRNMWALLAWMQAEGGEAKNNPLNTTEEWPGATIYNWVGVKNYPSFKDGVAATARTLNYGAEHRRYGYAAIRKRLRNDAWAYNTLRAVEASDWGTGGLALRCLPWVKKDRPSPRRLTLGSRRLWGAVAIVLAVILLGVIGSRVLSGDGAPALQPSVQVSSVLGAPASIHQARVVARKEAAAEARRAAQQAREREKAAAAAAAAAAARRAEKPAAREQSGSADSQPAASPVESSPSPPAPPSGGGGSNVPAPDVQHGIGSG